MAIRDAARCHHDELFPGRTSTLAVTDPERVEVFDHRAFGDVFEDAPLDPRTRCMVQLAAMGACEPQLAGHVAGNLAVGNDRQVLVATLTQLLPFIGDPRTLNALRVLGEGTSA